MADPGSKLYAVALGVCVHVQSFLLFFFDVVFFDRWMVWWQSSGQP